MIKLNLKKKLKARIQLNDLKTIVNELKIWLKSLDFDNGNKVDLLESNGVVLLM